MYAHTSYRAKFQKNWMQNVKTKKIQPTLLKVHFILQKVMLVVPKVFVMFEGPKLLMLEN